MPFPSLAHFPYVLGRVLPAGAFLISSPVSLSSQGRSRSIRFPPVLGDIRVDAPAFPPVPSVQNSNEVSTLYIKTASSSSSMTLFRLSFLLQGSFRYHRPNKDKRWLLDKQAKDSDNEEYDKMEFTTVRNGQNGL